MLFKMCQDFFSYLIRIKTLFSLILTTTTKYPTSTVVGEKRFWTHLKFNAISNIIMKYLWKNLSVFQKERLY